MMTREEVAAIISYCKEHSVSYKTRLTELGIPQWRFYDSRSKYAKEQSEVINQPGEFLQLTSDGGFSPMPSFAPSRKKSKKDSIESEKNALSIELRTPTGVMMRIQGEFTQTMLQSLIQSTSTSGHV